MYTVDITRFDVTPGTDKELYATWNCKLQMIAEYKIQWYKWVGFWLFIKEETTRQNHITFTAPSESSAILIKMKPVSLTREVNGVDTHYWYGEWVQKSYAFVSKPTTPSAPTVEVSRYNLTCSITNIDIGDTAEFQIAENDNYVFNTGRSGIVTNSSSYTCSINSGNKYKARVRVWKDGFVSDWSDWSSNINTIPSTPPSPPVCRGSSSTSVLLAWLEVPSAESYDIEYTENKNYFDSSDKTQTVTGIKTTKYEKTGLESGKEYFFRVRAVNTQGSSDWSDISSVVIGKTPDIPTTWSSSSTVISGEDVVLYWVHNTQDGSTCTYSKIELNVNGKIDNINLKNDSSEDDETDKVMSYTINTSQYASGTKIKWRVCTAGVTMTYGGFSVERVIDVYAPPTLSITLRNSNDESVIKARSLPLKIVGVAGPSTQSPIGYHLSIISNQTYETVDEVGDFKIVNKGDTIFSKYYDVKTKLTAILSAGDISLKNTMSYTIRCIVTMSSGLTAEANLIFTVAWDYNIDIPNADLGYDSQTLTTRIRPYCINSSGAYVTDVTLSVYRREYDGSYTLINEGLQNGRNTFINDPHPALDFARYRIVATSTKTGNVTYSDIPGYPIQEKSVIIQWDEVWTNFDSVENGITETPPWSGSMLKLPYNIDISDNSESDSELVSYIGRKRPVSYYGTQIKETSTWNVEIVKSDKDTLYALRRLANWNGDVYVREPSGSGYWANISVSFSQKHAELTIPVTFEITRVEGGV